MAAFILARHTPRQFRLESAREVAPSPKGYSFLPLRRSDPEAERVQQVTDALMASARQLRDMHKPIDLKSCLEHAQKSPYALLVEGLTYTPKQANGRPAMVVVK